MSRSGRQKDKYGNHKELSRDDSSEGTAARTRPFSFEEIMLRRKQKKLAEDINLRDGERTNSPQNGNGNDAFEHLEDRTKRANILGARMNVLNDTIKEISRNKEASFTRKEGDISKGKESHELKVNMKGKSSKDKNNRDKGDKNEKRSHHRTRVDDRKFDFKNESEKKHAKDVIGKHGERDKSSNRESKRKHQSGIDDRSRSQADGAAYKKHDSGRWQDKERLERKEREKDLSQFHHEEVRQKRRRSVSRERVKDRDRRSISSSPRAQKRVSHHGKDPEVSSNFASKERSGRHDKSRASINGGHGSGHYRRRGGQSSGLGGYSPRKRRTEVAVKTPSPTIRSPERKSATWDLPPPGTDKVAASSSLTSVQSVSQVTPLNSHELLPSGPVPQPTLKSQPVACPNIVSTTKDLSVDSIQLTQATRPMRRLYIENVPPSASDKAIVECFNDFFLSSGFSHIKGTQPCISCITNKEKGQALVEFLTPEDATSALSFDGSSFSGSVLKIRRPKDFVEAATRIPEKPAIMVATVSDVVKDSPHKIFVGGISKALSSDMLMEIVSAFGLLKAYRFVVSTDFDEPFAFLEYVDQSVTPKACAGLNGMKLGGNILTVVQAIPGASGQETAESPFCGVPDHAKPLLEKPTQVLKITNVFKQEEFSLLSESELEETLEDVRLECARFGTIKSVNIVRYDSQNVVYPEATANTIDSRTNGASMDACGDAGKTASPKEYHNDDFSHKGDSEPPSDSEKVATPDERIDYTVDEGNPAHDEVQDIENVTESVKENEPVHGVENFTGEPASLDSQINLSESLVPDAAEDESECLEKSTDDLGEGIGGENSFVPEYPVREEGDGKVQDDIEPKETIGEKPDNGSCGILQQTSNLEMFEEGSILIEYVWKEAACVAAHCLHGRLYGDQIVAAGYVPYDLFRVRYPR